MRNYKSNTDFKAGEPFVFPKTKKFKAVVVDRGYFPALPKMNKKRDSGVLDEEEEKAREERRRKKMKFVDKFKYREQNVAKIRHLFL